MKFDYCCGNPPYNEEAPGESTSDKPVYHTFMDACHSISDKTMLITPARFLFNAGATPKAWNKAMLEDCHFKVLEYESDSKVIFPDASITGGIAITYYDLTKKYVPVDVFIPYPELNNIRNKIVSEDGYRSLSGLVSGRTPYLFTDKMHQDYPDAAGKLSKGHSMDISSNAFEMLPEVFTENKPDNEMAYFRVLGRKNSSRTYCWIKREYAKARTDDIGKWKVFLPKANGASGMLGEEAARLISKPVVGKPNDIATDTFICVGAFDTEGEAVATYKYILSKFARCLLGTLKVTQINSKNTWNNVPLQDFTPNSDINWSASIRDIDQQLYKKYGLSQQEIDFIESHVKEMA